MCNRGWHLIEAGISLRKYGSSVPCVRFASTVSQVTLCRRLWVQAAPGVETAIISPASV